MPNSDVRYRIHAFAATSVAVIGGASLAFWWYTKIRAWSETVGLDAHATIRNVLGAYFVVAMYSAVPVTLWILAAGRRSPRLVLRVLAVGVISMAAGMFLGEVWMLDDELEFAMETIKRNPPGEMHSEGRRWPVGGNCELIYDPATGMRAIE